MIEANASRQLSLATPDDAEELATLHTAVAEDLTAR